MAAAKPLTTTDALFEGRVRVIQPARGVGYRVNVDAILLAAFAAGRLANASTKPRTFKHAVDLGAGVGGVALSLLHLGGARRVTLVEIDEGLASLARETAAANGWDGRIEVVVRDVAARRETIPFDPRADLVVCNPPYGAPTRGRAPATARAARFSGAGAGGSLDAFACAARNAAGRGARIAFVYPAIETANLLATLRARGLEPKRLCAVHGRPADAARVVLVEACAAKPGGLVLEPPLVETDAEGRPTAQIAALLAHPPVAVRGSSG